MTFNEELTDKIDSLPKISEVLKIYGLSPTKSLGQNFLFDMNITDKIVRNSEKIKDKIVIEIGSGPGGLTRSLIKSSATKIIVIEKDKIAVEIAHDLKKIALDKLEIIQDDALNISLRDLADKYCYNNKFVIIANLPYNISTKLLTNWFEEIEYIDEMILMFQKEVALKITGKAGSNNYGRLAVSSNFLCNTNYLFDVHPKSFTPAPKVTSAVIKLIPNDTRRECSYRSLNEIVKVAFNQRRKMLRVSLKEMINSNKMLEEFLNRNPNYLTKRAEELSVDDFIDMANCISAS